jgi:hypothetical protein
LFLHLFLPTLQSYLSSFLPSNSHYSNFHFTSSSLLDSIRFVPLFPIPPTYSRSFYRPHTTHSSHLFPSRYSLAYRFIPYHPIRRPSDAIQSNFATPFALPSFSSAHSRPANSTSTFPLRRFLLPYRSHPGRPLYFFLPQ